MAEATETQVQETATETAQSDYSTKMLDAIWGDAPMPAPVQTTTETKVEEVKTEDTKVEAPQVSEWYKSLGWENEEAAKTEIQKLKETKPQEEVKFANDDSRKAYEYLKEGKEDDLYSFLAKKKTIEKLLGSDVTDSNAADIIKFSLKNKFSEFTDADVERKFNRTFGIPKEPSMRVDELEDEFKARHDEWKEKVDEIKADMLLEAKTIKPDLAKLKSELVLPDIQKNNSEVKREPTQEEIAAFTKQKESFLQATEGFLKGFNGFSTQVKDKDVDYNVSYGASQEEKVLASQIAKEFAESGFDANAIFVKDWLNQDGTLNVQRVIEDKILLATKDKVFQKIANDAANQRLELYLKDKKNIRIDGGGGKDFGATEQKKDISTKLQEDFWGN